MKNKELISLGLKKACCCAFILCFTFGGCSEGILQNELKQDDVTSKKMNTRSSVLDAITVNGEEYEILDGIGFITTIGCVVANTTSHLSIKISYPTLSSRGSLIHKVYKDFYDYNFSQTNIYDWSNPIESIVEDQLNIEDKVCVPVDGSDINLTLDITANDGPNVWGGEKESIWIRYYLTHKDYTFRYLKLENSEDDPQHYKASLDIPFNSDNASSYIYLGDVRIAGSNGYWGPKYLSY